MKKFYTSILLIVISSFVCFAQTETDTKTVDSQPDGTKINLIVTDKNNDFVSNLGKEDISFFIDGKEQTNFTIERETLPLLYMISIDNSGSMRLVLENIIAGAKSIISENKADDLTALMRFVSLDIIQTTEKFTSEQDYLFKNLDKFQVEGGQTALIDAIFNSVKIVGEQKTAQENYRRIVVIISDGEDRASQHTEKQLFDLLAENDVQIFFVSLAKELSDERDFISKSPKKKAEDFIENVVEKSGGAAIVPKKIEDLPKIANQIVNRMRTQFVIKLPAVENLGDKKLEIKSSEKSKKRKLKFNFRVDLMK